MGHRWRTIAIAIAALTLVAGACGPYLPQPRSKRTGPAVDQVEFVWSGALGARSARVNAKLVREGRAVLLMRPAGDAEPESLVLPSRQVGRVVSFALEGLEPDTSYVYTVVRDGRAETARVGHLRTPAEGPTSFTVALSSCARTGSRARIFQTIASHAPLFFVHMGDLHYENIAANDPGQFRRAYDAVLASPGQSALYRDVPIVYMFDDHDFGPNNTHGGSPSAAAARRVYREYVPHHELAAGWGDVPLYQAFTIGRARFIVTDLRSARSPQEEPDSAQKTMLGTEQKRWLKEEMRRANGRYPLIVWVSTVPWVAAREAGADHWGGYAHERRELATYFAEIGLAGLVIVSGDAHMLAIDDGTHADYSAHGGPAIPVLQASPLDQFGFRKGGPYSEGMFPGVGQFALMTVEDDGGAQVRVTWSGRDWKDREIVGWRFRLP